MDFIAIDISIVLSTVLLATTGLVLYSFLSGISSINRQCVDAFAVVDIIRTLKENCPVGFGSKWRLLPLNSGLLRCWTKKVPLPGFQNDLSLYGTACEITCSSMYALSLIADVAKWGEWEPLQSSHCLLSKPFCDMAPKDTFMLADQVVGIQRGTDIQSYIAMYRFMCFPEKTVKWILFWNAKKIEFKFFLIQPAISKTVHSQCVITHIFGSKQLSHHLASSVAQRLQNIREYLLMSQLHIIASKYIPSTPTIILSHPHHDPLKQKCDLECKSFLEPSDHEDTNAQYKFMLVPISRSLKLMYRKVTGFHLMLKEVDKDSKSKQQPQLKRQKKEKTVKACNKAKQPLRKTISEICIKPQHHNDFDTSLNLKSRAYTAGNDLTENPLLRMKNSILVEEKLNLDVSHLNEKFGNESSLSQCKQLVHKSLSEPCVASTNGYKASSGSEVQTDEETYINLHVIHENVAEENESSSQSAYDKNDIFCSSTSDYELMDTNPQFLDCKLADFLTQGNYGASVLQTEMLLASQFNNCLSPEEQAFGGWVYHFTYKGITVLSKTTAGQFTNILGFLCQIELPVPTKDVWKCVKNPMFRFICDETVKTVKIVERISDSQKLIHVYHETSGFMKKESVDFCLLQTEREEANLFYSTFHSMEYEKCPLMTSVVRGSLKPSGWVVERLGTKRCKITHLVQVIVNSPDSLFIQELSSLVPMSMYNLKHYIMAKPN